VWRLYAIPIIGTGLSRLDPRRPKYVVEGGYPWALMDYGSLPTGLVAADVTQAQHDALTTVRARLEANRIPTQWVTGATTYRELARFVAGLFQFAQRHTALHAEDIIGSGALDGRFRDLDAAQQARIQATATSFGYTLTAGANTPMRDVLTQMANQWGAQPFYLGGLTF
jgi:hypothetical protein